jgi:hypothetical protein
VEVKRLIESTGLVSDMDRAVPIFEERTPGDHRTVSTLKME